MILSLDAPSLCRYVTAQLDHFFPDGDSAEGIAQHMQETLDRMATCLAGVDDPYYTAGEDGKFHHLHSDQYAMFLYLLSNTLYRNDAARPLCTKIYYLNKALHGIDVYYEVELPRIFLFNHPVGTVLGRATYSDFLLVYQNCTVGRWRTAGGASDYPVLGRYLALYTGSSVLGPCTIGDNCKIAANSVLADRDLEAGKIFFGDMRGCTIKENKSPDKCWRVR